MQAPALYWYFKNKEELIDHMAETILANEFFDLTPRTNDESWQEWLIDVCKRLRSAMLAHRDGARVVAGAHLYPAITLVRLFEVSMESLLSAGVDERQADLLIGTVVHLTFGRVIEEQSSPDPNEIERFNHDEFHQAFPLVSANIRRTVEDMKQGYDEFDASLRLIIR